MWMKLSELMPGGFFVDESGRLRQKIGHDPKSGKCLVHSFQCGVWDNGIPTLVGGFGVVKVVQPAQFMSEVDPGTPYVVVDYDGITCVEEAAEAYE